MMKWFWFALYYLVVAFLLCWVNHGVAENNKMYEEEERNAKKEMAKKSSKRKNAL